MGKREAFQALVHNLVLSQFDLKSRLNTKEKLRVASMKIVSFTRAVRIKGEEFLKKSSEEGRRLRDEVAEKSMDMLKKTPGIKGILLLTKKARDLRRSRF